jgi:hypothetical protein
MLEDIYRMYLLLIYQTSDKMRKGFILSKVGLMPNKVDLLEMEGSSPSHGPTI